MAGIEKLLGTRSPLMAGIELLLRTRSPLIERITGCFIMNATKVFSNNFYSKAPYELKLVPYFH